MLPRPRKNDKEVAECDVRGDACDRETLVGLVHLWNARIVHPYDGIREELLELLWRDAKLFEDYGRHPVARHLESALLNADKDRRDQLQLVKLRVGVRVAKPRVREEDSPHPRLPLDELAALEQLLVLGKNFARGSNVNHVLDGHDPHRERHAGGQGLLRLWCDLWHGSVPTDSFASRRARAVVTYPCPSNLSSPLLGVLNKTRDRAGDKHTAGVARDGEPLTIQIHTDAAWLLASKKKVLAELL